MMKLYCSLTSPYARKVRVAIEELGLSGKVEMVVLDPWSDPPELRAQNPLGRVPALETDDGLHLPDSRLILAWLQSVARRKLATPPKGRVWWELARRVQLADSVLDAAVAVVIETKKRPAEFCYQGWLERQQGVIERGLAALEAEAGTLIAGDAKRIGIMEITLACTLGYLRMRQPDFDLRARFPALAAWYTVAAQRESMRASAPPTS